MAERKNKNKIIKEKVAREETEQEYEKFIKKLDKIFEKEFGKMCPDFEPSCFKCRINLTYNQFKKNLFEEFVQDKKK